MDVVLCPEASTRVLVVEVRPPRGHPIVRWPQCGQRYEMVGRTLVPVVP